MKRVVPMLLFAACMVSALRAAPVVVPKDLQDWQPWVMDGQEQRSGGRLSPSWQLNSEARVPLVCRGLSVGGFWRARAKNVDAATDAR